MRAKSRRQQDLMDGLVREGYSISTSIELSILLKRARFCYRAN